MKFDITRTSTRYNIDAEQPHKDAELYKATGHKNLYQIDFHSLKELLSFIKDEGIVVIHTIDHDWDEDSDNEFELEIYDTYRE